MPEIYLPFNAGQHEEADARILPAGMLSSVRNMRIRKDGRLVSRWGYRADSVTYPGYLLCRAIETDRGAILYDQKQLIFRKFPGPSGSAYGSNNIGDGSNQVSLFAGVTRYEAARNMFYQTTARGEKQDCAVINATLSTAHVLAAYDDVGSTTYGSVFLSYNRAGDLISRFTIQGWVQPTLASYGSAAYAIVRDSSAMTAHDLYVYVPATRQWTRVRGLTPYAAAGDTTGTAVLAPDGILYIMAHKAAAQWDLQRYNPSGGAYTTLATLTTITSGAAVISMCVLPDGSWLVTGNTAGTVVYEQISNAGGVVATGTLFTATGTEAAVGACTVREYGNYWAAAVTTQKPGGGNSRVRTWYVDGGGGHAGPIYEASSLQSKPVQLSVFGQTVVYAWIADAGLTWAAPPAVLPRATLRLVPIAGRDGLSTSEATAMVQQAYAGAPTGGGFDCRRTIAMATAVANDATSPNRIYHQQPLFGLPATDLVAVDWGTYADGLNGVTTNAQTFISGARLFEFDGMAAFPAGLENGPVAIVATDAGSGTGVDAGTHQYVGVWRAIDANGNIHRSPPSPIASVTLGVAHNVYITMAQGNMNPVVAGRQTQLEVYRTDAGGTVLRLAGISAGGAGSYTDSMPDATLLAQPALYTMGERGGLSSLLPNEEPGPCRYLCAGDARLFAGGLELPNDVVWSKLFYPGEQVSWSTSTAYRRTLPEPVTAVGYLDGAWIAFTRSAIYEFSGAGPSDNGADGDFGDPRKRPGDVGCISHRSVVSCSLGLLFQGTNGGMWLLPRGGNAPQWIGQPVRDTLTTYPVVRGACLAHEENCVYWALCTATGSAGILLVYDLRNGQWYTDTIASKALHSLGLFDGHLLLDGTILQTPDAYTDEFTLSSTTAIFGQLVTGDIRPFGEAGWGRCRMFGILGETVSATSFTCEISYDSGVTYDDEYTWALSMPGELGLQFGPSQVRGTNYRIRVSSSPSPAGAGVALNTLALEVYKSERLKRLPAAQRG